MCIRIDAAQFKIFQCPNRHKIDTPLWQKINYCSPSLLKYMHVKAIVTYGMQ